MIFGIPIILGFYIFRDKPQARLIWFTSAVICMQLVSDILNFAGWVWTMSMTAIQIVFAMAAFFIVTKYYDGKKGKHPVFAKYFFYIFYPLHLLIFYLIKAFVPHSSFDI